METAKWVGLPLSRSPPPLSSLATNSIFFSLFFLQLAVATTYSKSASFSKRIESFHLLFTTFDFFPLCYRTNLSSKIAVYFASESTSLFLPPRPHIYKAPDWLRSSLNTTVHSPLCLCSHRAFRTGVQPCMSTCWDPTCSQGSVDIPLSCHYSSSCCQFPWKMNDLSQHITLPYM